MAQRVDTREEKRKMQRTWSRRMNFEQRLNEVFELINFCHEMKEAFNKNGYKKCIQRTSHR
ncbi:MAG: hypothetical protein D6726_06050, partial [Nitrospirae bacterium]